MAESTPWTCPNCRLASQAEAYCPACYTGRYPSWAIQIAEHVLEHIADGLSTPLDVLKALKERQCYLKADLSLQFVSQQMRLLTVDTTKLARDLAKARAARMMLEVCETGDTKDKIAVMKGIQVLGEVIEHKGETITRHVVELHEGPPPKREV